jgi:hypothetical protein
MDLPDTDPRNTTKSDKKGVVVYWRISIAGGKRTKNNRKKRNPNSLYIV